MKHHRTFLSSLYILHVYVYCPIGDYLSRGRNCVRIKKMCSYLHAQLDHLLSYVGVQPDKLATNKKQNGCEDKRNVCNILAAREKVCKNNVLNSNYCTVLLHGPSQKNFRNTSPMRGRTSTNSFRHWFIPIKASPFWSSSI